MKRIWKINDWQIAIALALICLVVVLSVFLPVLNSDDDFFLMYQLAGGFGEAPTNQLHFDHVIHPWIGFILSGLFKANPNFNWYTGFLILCQFLSWVLISKALLFLFQRRSGIFVFLMLFVFAGVNGLQALNMTSTTWLLSIASMVYLICFRGSIVFCFFLLFLAGSIRLQIPIIVVTLFLPLQWIKDQQFPRKVLIFLTGLVVIFFMLNLAQKKYYIANIPGWKAAEDKRQAVFYGFNRPKDLEKNDSLFFYNKMEKAFYDRVFLYDEQFPSTERLAQISKARARVRDLSQKEDVEELYWTWAAWRLYLLYLLVMVLIAWQNNKLIPLIRRSWLPFSGLIAFYIFLFMFYKFTEAFFMGILLMMAFQFVLLWPGAKSNFKRLFYLPFLFLLPMAWSISRDLRADKVNREEFQKFSCAAKELAKDDAHLFIATGDALPLNYFKYNALPKDYQLGNLIYKERVLTRNYLLVLKKFGVKENLLLDLHSTALKFVGPEFPELLIQAGKNGDSLRFSQPDSVFKCLEVRTILMK